MIDMNGDGLLDILLAQTCEVLFENHGKLLWLEQPTDPTTAKSWTTHELISGPGLSFIQI